ncbi:MAG: DNA cytosine methyltransferase [Malacoplasma sp.]|nr:DNA cytosine methyltransferase [Malacoplasma sp.]
MKEYSINEIALITCKTVKFIRREVAKGSLKSFKKGNKTLIFEHNLNEWKTTSLAQIINVFASTNPIRSNKTNKAKKKADLVNWIDVSQEMKQIDAWKDNSQIRDFNFVDLFTGAGGLSCGLTMSGMMPVGSVEIMREAVQTYKLNFSKIKGFEENVADKDIRDKKIKQELIASLKNKHIHLIAGGFPCQGFSMAGNRIIADPRNSLYLDMLDIVKQIKPDFVLMENVEGLRSMMGGKIEQKIIGDYKKIGYEINVTVLNSADYGVAQFRKRVIFIGNRIGIKNYHPKPIFNETNFVTVGDVLNKYLKMAENNEINHIFSNTTESMQKRLEALPIGKSLYGNYSDAWKKVDWNKPSCTVKENHGGVNVHPILNRVMTPRELATLQSFPEDFIFCGAKKWQLVQIGNAVPCLLAKAIGLAILRAYEERKNN